VAASNAALSMMCFNAPVYGSISYADRSLSPTSHRELSLGTYAVPSASFALIVVPVNGVVRIVRASSSAGDDAREPPMAGGRTGR
jgi:hypothetical protein